MTIYAPATAPGVGAVAIIRISGSKAKQTLMNLFSKKEDPLSHMLRYGYLKDGEEIIDEVMAVYFQAPHSYTREDMVELHCHGAQSVITRVMELLAKQGLRLSEPGEFTKRAFLNGRINLTQAEAVMSLISSTSQRSREASLQQMQGALSEKITSCRDDITDILAMIEASIDYPEENLDEENISMHIDAVLQKLYALRNTFHTGELIREGVKVAIVGRPNVGKSSLLNAMLGHERAIVTDIPGTTRDVLCEYFQINGLMVRLYDTAGIRESEDQVEQIGVARSKEAILEADVVLQVLDTSQPLTPDDIEASQGIASKPFLLALNKSDIAPVLEEDAIRSSFPHAHIVTVSALTGAGMDDLLSTIYTLAIGEADLSTVTVNARHRESILRAIAALQEAKAALPLVDEECLSIDIRFAWEALGEIIGATTTEDLLDRIFSKFCLGK